MLSLEAPAVPREELKTAVGWRLKDMLDFHIDDATIDVLAIPGAQAGQNESNGRRREEEAKFRRRAADELGELERKLASLQQELGRATAQENRSIIRSPMSMDR